MANLNNIYYNAAYTGFISGALSGRAITSAVAASYLKLTQAAQAFAKQVDSLIAEDALVSTGGGDPTELSTGVAGDQTIIANEQWRAGLLQGICKSVAEGRYTEDAVQADYTVPAAAAKAVWTEALLLLVTP